jgi:hypothetical protein
MAGLAETSIVRLALGIEVVDAARDQRTGLPISVVFDDVARGNIRPRLLRHASNRFTLTYDDYFTPQPRTADIRVFDSASEIYATRTDNRRLIPRRFRFALRSLAQAEAQSPLSRTCRPRLFPGAAYPIGNVYTGLRGRAMRQAAGDRPLRPARWVRALATVPPNEADLSQAAVVGRAMGDDRGEFLLLINSGAFAGPPQKTLAARITIFAPAETEPIPADLPQRDPLWDAPREEPNSFADSDTVLRGEALPAGYAKVAERIVALPVGRLLRGQADYTF